MKPIRLEVEGLQSYVEPVVVDFEALGRYGLFGIFGPIGSGKSSLLDALTLALYGLVDRVSGRSKKGVINADAARMEVRLTFSVRSPEGVAEIYEVHRSYRPIQEDGPTTAQRIASRLMQHTEGGVACTPPLVLADKEREVNDSVAAIVGLCAEDFMRAVVLPQGRFLDVLHLKGSERRGMLQRIFRLSAYGAQLRQKLRGRQQEQRERLAAIDGELQGLGPASVASVAAARQELADAREERSAAAAVLREARALHEAAMQARRQHAQLTEARGALEALVVQAPMFDARANAVAEADTLGPQRGLLSRWSIARERSIDAEVRAGHAHSALALANTSLVEAEAQLEVARSAHGLRSSPLDDTLRALEALSRRVASDASLPEQREQAIRRAQRARERRREIDEDLDVARATLGELEPHRRSLRRKLGKVRVTLEERRHVAEAVDAHRALSAAQERHERATEAAHLAEESLAQRQQVEATATLEAGAVQARVELAAHTLGALPPPDEAPPGRLLELGQERIDAVLVAWSRTQQAEAAKAAHLPVLEGAEVDHRQRVDAATALDAAHRAFEEARRAHEQSHAAAQLAANLKPHDPCPVCGSPEHPAPAPSAEEPPRPPDPDELLRAREAAEAQARALASARAELHGLDAALAASSERMGEARSALSQLAPEISELASDTPIDDLVAVAARALEAARDRAVDHAAKLRERTELEAALQVLRLESERAQGPLHAAQEALERAQSDARAAAAILDEASAAVGVAWSRWSDVAGEHTTLFDVPQLQRRIDARDAEARDLERALTAADLRREQLQQQLADGQHERAAALADVAEADAAREHIDGRWQTLHSDLVRALAPNAPQEPREPRPAGDVDSEAEPTDDAVVLAQLSSALEVRLGDLRAEGKQLDATLASTTVAREQARTARADAAATHASASTAAEGARQALGEAWSAWVELAPGLHTHGDAPSLPAPLPEAVGEALAALAARIEALPSTEALSAWRTELAEQQAKQQRLEARIDALSGEAEALPSPGTFARLEDEVASSTRRAEATVDAAARAQASHDALVERLARVQELQKQRSGAATDLERLDQLGALLRGDRFVEFVANDLLRELAATATEHLHTLSEGRYALVLDGQGGFLVQDADAGGSTRPVTSLSGGESFLSALALALALSTQIQARGAKPLEFFFLDEGFGSLDPEALDRVMSAIERLNDGHRVIGLISHVPGVRERIPMHLVVHPAGTRQRGSAVELRIQ